MTGGSRLMAPVQLEDVAASLLAKIGKKGNFNIYQLAGGANNKVFRVDSENSKFLLKEYFWDANDPRDRLKTEYSFCEFAWDKGIRSLPQPFVCDKDNNMALYEFVEGRHLEVKEIKEQFVTTALGLYSELNKWKKSIEAGKLPYASEACFSINDHLECVNNRIERLKSIEVSSSIDNDASDFINNKLAEVWKDVVFCIKKRFLKLDIDLDAAISESDRCLSPSDFGFHNALLSADGGIRFIDFEYAGWDDPAKMVCDFFCQPKVPVPMVYYDMVVNAVVDNLTEPKFYADRMASLLPVYQIKWCCILLNDFQPVGSRRRDFSKGLINKDKQKSEQLNKARIALKNASELNAN